MITTIAILAVAAVFFAMGKVRSDLVALCALVALLLTGILTPQEALSGFANPVVIMMVGLFVVGGAIVQTGRQRVATLPPTDDCNGSHRSIREQHGHSGTDDAHRGEFSTKRRHQSKPTAYASRLCKQHGRYAHAYRYTA